MYLLRRRVGLKLFKSILAKCVCRAYLRSFVYFCILNKYTRNTVFLYVFENLSDGLL